jgi:pimeloyl-ACP methyl ester carboxylesterase
MKISANGIDLEVEDSGAGFDASGRPLPVLLLIMGLGMQLVAWPPAFIDGLVQAGFRVLRFDNRDIGLSQHFDSSGTPNLLWEGLKYRLGMSIRAPYTLQDMARDSVGVLDALSIDRAHIIGVSMGGMIAQRMALLAPTRVASLVSVMSSSGAPGLPATDAAVMRVLLSRPRNKSMDAAIAHSMRLLMAISSPGFPAEEALLNERVTLSIQRNHHPDGLLRQMMAIAADTSRASELASIRVPTLVVHGASDLLIPPACGEDTASRILNARLALIEGMGHDLPAGVVERLLPLLTAHVNASIASSVKYGV